MPDVRRYIVAFLITTLIFGTALYASARLNDRRISEISKLQEGISTDILSLETQFDLFENHLSCKNLTEHTVLSTELSNLASRLQYAENTLGADNEDVLRLKRSYTLLQIKDYVLMTRIVNRCGGGPTFVLYFYSNEDGKCEDCTRQGYVLSALSEEFPEDVRVYAFDYNLPLGVLETLVSLNKVEERLPALIVDGKKIYGYQDTAAMEKLIPKITKVRAEREKEALRTQAASSSAN